MGYDLVIYPVTMQRVAMGSVTSALARLKDDGIASGLLDGMQTREQLYDMLDYKPDQPWSRPGSREPGTS